MDSGGQGLVQILKGAVAYYQGETQKAEDFVYRINHPEESVSDKEAADESALKDIRCVYATEYTILTEKTLNSKAEKDFRKFLEAVSEEVSYTASEGMIRISLNTNDPGLVLQRGLMYGELTEISIINRKNPVKPVSTPAEENIPEAANEPVQEPAVSAEKKDIGFVAVAAGDGLAEIFRSLGVDVVISGGQTMNPSTEDILKAVETVNADTVFVLPNNKNIIMAASQAASLVSEKQVLVIPTRTIPQGISAVINYIPDPDTQKVYEDMKEAASAVRSAEVTYAVRDTEIDGTQIHEGNMMAIGDSGIAAVGQDRNRTSLEALQAMAQDGAELISIYYGAEVTEEEASAFAKIVAEKFPDCEIELQYGGQPVYYYILSAE